MASFRPILRPGRPGPEASIRLVMRALHFLRPLLGAQRGEFLLFMDSHFMSDEATGRSAGERVMACDMTRNATNDRARETTGVRLTHHKYRQGQRRQKPAYHVYFSVNTYDQLR